jgi:ubiquinol-cytochrome c reductase cytochrome b subunit
LGVVSMFVAILILLVLPFTDTSNIKGSGYKPLYIIAFWLFALNFLVLMWLGSCHVEAPFVIAGQIATAYYFSHFLIILPILGIVENVLSLIGTSWTPSNINFKEINS